MISFIATAMAAATAIPSFTLETKGTVVTATPPPAHHFNVKAPILPKPAHADEHKVVFENITGPFRASIYLCDDKNTYCVKKTEGDPNAPEPAAGIKPSAKAKTDRFGFIMNDEARAFEQAKAENKPLLIDFFGIWCPPCNQLDAEVWSSKEFKAMAKQFVLLKMDADDSRSWPLKGKYKVSGYPTVIFADQNGEEISRFVGFFPKNSVAESMKKASANRASPVSKILAKAESGAAEAQLEVGKWFLERHEFENAAKWLAEAAKKIDAAKESLRRAEWGIAEKNKDDKFTALLEKTRDEFKGTLLAFDAESTLSEIYSERNAEEWHKKATEMAKSAVKTGEELLHKLNPATGILEGSDLEATDLWAQIADLKSSQGDAAGAKEAWLEAAKLYQKKIKAAPGSDHRGHHLELAFCLYKTGDFDGATKIYERFETKYPKEFTFWYAHARMEMSRKEWGKAATLMAKALDHSYGDNKLRASKAMADILEAQGKAADSLALVEKTLKEAVKPLDLENRTNRYLKILEDMKTKLIGVVSKK